MTSPQWPGPRGDREGSTECNGFDAGQANELAAARQAEAKLAAVRASWENYLEGEEDWRDEDRGISPLVVAIGLGGLVLLAAAAAWWFS